MNDSLWHQPGDKEYVYGVDRGMVYPHNIETGVPWNGLTSVKTQTEDGSRTPIYNDGSVVEFEVNPGRFRGSIEAFSYPEEFGENCLGERPMPGLGVTAYHQPRGRFDFTYRERLGNDLEGTDSGYRINLITNALASDSDRDASTVSDSTEPGNFSWDIDAIPTNYQDTDGDEEQEQEITWQNLVSNPRGRSIDGTVTIAENLLPNPRGRNTSGTVVVVQNYTGDPQNIDPDFDLVGGDLHAPAPVGYMTPDDNATLYYSRTRDCLAAVVRTSQGMAVLVQSLSPPVTDAPVDYTVFTEVLDSTVSTSFCVGMGSGDPGLSDTVSVPVGEQSTAISYVTNQSTNQPGRHVRHLVSGLGGSAVVGQTIYFRSMLIRDEYHGPYFDGHMQDEETGDPDFTYSWDGGEDDSTSIVTAPSPSGWAQQTTLNRPGLVVFYYSETHDMVGAMFPKVLNGWRFGGFEITIPTGVHTLMLEYYNPHDSVWVNRPYYLTGQEHSVPPGRHVFRDVVDSDSGAAPWLMLRRASADTPDYRPIYVRALVTPEEYEEDYFDGDTEGREETENYRQYRWLGAAHASPSYELVTPKDENDDTERVFSYPDLPTAHLVFDTRRVAPEIIETIEAILYDENEARIPDLTEINQIVADIPLPTVYNLITNPSGRRVL